MIVEQVSVDGPIVAGNIELIINTVINNANYKMNGSYNLVKYNLFINLVIVTIAVVSKQIVLNEVLLKELTTF